MIRHWKKIALLAVLGAFAAAFGFWILISPGNPFTRLFRSSISDIDARIVIGPYPLEDDFRLLKLHGVTTVVSLLNPALPYETILLESERKLADAYGILLRNFPMSSIFGQRFGEDYDQNADAAAAAIAEEPGKIYLHCYLGSHRVKAVENRLAARGTIAGTYLAKKGERSEIASEIDQAHADYRNGRFAEALARLKALPDPDVTALLLQAWCSYHLGDLASAEKLFARVVATSPDVNDAHAGLGYTALRGGDLDRADREFSSVLARDPKDAAALSGLGFVRYRQGRSKEAAKFFRTVLAMNPDNSEARDMLDRIGKPSPPSPPPSKTTKRPPRRAK